MRHTLDEARRSSSTAVLVSVALLVALGACKSEQAPSMQTASTETPLLQSPLTASFPWAVRLGAINGAGCSAYVLSKHWVMTVAHCVVGRPVWFQDNIIFTPAAGVLEYIYSGLMIRVVPANYLPGTQALNDMALVYLWSGLSDANYARTGQVFVYKDARLPWTLATDADRTFWIAGYGRGGDPSGPTRCIEGDPGGYKRANTLVLNTSLWLDKWVWGNGGAAACTGDSGAPMFLERDGKYLVFSHVVGGNWRDDVVGVMDPFTQWIHDESVGIDARYALSLQLGQTRGVTYGQYVEASETCPAGTTACGNACADLTQNELHCGACNNTCPQQGGIAYPVCSNSQCGFECLSGATECNGVCVSLSWDAQNCGSCGNACTSPTNGTAVCTNGLCGAICPAGLTLCGNTCTDTASDSNNCGACNNVCSSGGLCSNGQCILPIIEPGQRAAGEAHTCAIVNGAAKCWGYNNVGQVGDGSLTPWLYPTQVVGLTSGVQAIAAGSAHTCAIVNGAAKCWGYNKYGQLGSGSTAQYSKVPVQVSGLTSGVQAIAAGSAHTCAIVNGAAKCWGYNSFGELGIGSSTSYSNVPVQVSGLTTGVQAISAAGPSSVVSNHTCAVVNGGARCWGLNNYGQLGDGKSESYSLVPVQVFGLSSNVRAIATGDNHTCAIVLGGVRCWGHGLAGQLGNSSWSNSSVPVQVTGLTNAQSVAAGTMHTCAIVNGGAQCWGYNSVGSLGNGSWTNSAVPSPVSGLTASVTAIAAGSYHSCAIVNGSTQCWGYNNSGQLGNFSATNSNVPVQVIGL